MKDIEVDDTISNLSSLNDTASPLKTFSNHLNLGSNYLYINRNFLSKSKIKIYFLQKRVISFKLK